MRKEEIAALRGENMYRCGRLFAIAQVHLLAVCRLLAEGTQVSSLFIYGGSSWPSVVMWSLSAPRDCVCLFLHCAHCSPMHLRQVVLYDAVLSMSG